MAPTSDDSRPSLTRQGGGSLRTVLFIAVIVLGIAAVLLVFGGGLGAS